MNINISEKYINILKYQLLIYYSHAIVADPVNSAKSFCTPFVLDLRGIFDI